MSKLTIKQKRFVDEYIISGNATDAALKAGYAKKAAYQTGAENLKKPQIRRIIDERLNELESVSIAKQDEVLKFLTAVMRGELTEQTLISQGEIGQRITSIEVSSRDRIKAAELLGKRYGTWTEKVDLEIIKPEIVFDVDDGK